MPINLDKDSYSPEEAYNLIKQHLGDGAANQFKMYYNKIQKVPPHNVNVHEISNFNNDGMFEYRFSFGEFAQKLGIPPEVIEFTIVPSGRHGGGGADNMGWVRLKFRNYQEIPIAILDECQSDFAQRASRLRLIYMGKLKEDDLNGFERGAWDKIKNNPELIQVISSQQPGQNSVNPVRLSYINQGKTFYITVDNEGVEVVENGGNTEKYATSDTVFSAVVGALVHDFNLTPVFADGLYKHILSGVSQFKAQNNQGTQYQPTQLLKSCINKIESTSYSDILNYLFNKSLGFAKGKGAQFLFVPSAKMLLELWKSYAKEGAEDLYKRVYDQNAQQYGGAKDTIKHNLGDYYIIDLNKVPEIRMASKVVLSRYWKAQNGMDSNNWRIYLDGYIPAFKSIYQQEHTKDPEPQNEGGLMEDTSSDEFVITAAIEHFISEMLPKQAIGDAKFINEFIAYLQQKYNYTLPPEKQSILLYGEDGSGGGWGQVPQKENDPTAPTVDQLNKMFNMSTKKIRISDILIDEYLSKKSGLYY